VKFLNVFDARLPLLFTIAGTLMLAQDRPSGAQLLQQADRFADLYNWTAAKPLYSSAENQSNKEHNTRNALYAHIGFLRATMETGSLRDLSRYLAVQLESPLVKNDPRLLLKCLIAKGDTDAEIDSALAQTDWERVLTVSKRLNDVKWQNRAIGEIGFHRYVQGDHTQAKRDTAVALLSARKTRDIAAEIRFSSGIATGLALGGSQDEALKYLNLALDQAIQHPETGYPYMAVAGKTMALIGKHEYNDAVPLIQEQLAHARADDRFVKFTQGRLFLADVAIAKNDPQAAIRILTETLATAAHNRTRLLTEVYAKLTDLYQKRGSLREAEKAAKAGLAGAGESKSMYLAPEILLTLARLKAAEHRDSEAEQYFNRATDVVEGMLAQTTDIHARQALLTTMSYVYTDHFAMAAKNNDVESAYRIIERVRGRILSELLINKPTLKDLDELNPEIEDKITSLKLQLATASNPATRQRLVDELFFTKQALWVTERPRQITREPNIPISSVRNALVAGEALIEYVLTDQKSYCLLLSRSDMRLITLAPGQSISDEVHLLLAAVHDKKPADDREQSLYKALIEPLGQLEQYDHITIVADGALHLIPFEILKAPDHKYFGFKHTLTYAPSAGSEVILRNQEHSAAVPKFLGIGGVSYPQLAGAKPALELARSSSGEEYDMSAVRDLPSSVEEVKTAANLLASPNAVFDLGDDATKTALADGNLSQYSVIHFAVHAIANPKVPDSAALLLHSNPPKADGFLEAREILQLRLHSEMVVLSACNTAVGRLQGEEGVSNLSRAFLIAGSSSVVSTLWPVDDTYSLFLMKKFYQHLATRQEEADALRAAKLDLLDTFGNTTSPIYWAAFTIEGNGRSTIYTNQQSAANAHIRSGEN
jgi:CHAT domain-containing protein